MNNLKKKDLADYKQSQPEQLRLFEHGDDNYSNTIEFYDSMPKYYYGGVEREKGKNVDSLPILNRIFIHRNRKFSVDISPAAIQDKKSGKTIYYYPSQREELIEDVIRKISTKPSRAFYFDNDVGVKFTYYEVQQELKKIGHGYSIDQIKLGIEILNKSVIETTSKEGNEISITSTLFSYVGKETKEMGGKERVVVIFNPLVTKSINQGTYRLINYDKLMKMKMQVSRWLHRRMSHMFTQATVSNPYKILLSTIVRDSGMKSYKTISERMRQVEKALDELQRNNVISSWTSTQQKEKNKILDTLYSLFVSEEFVADAKKASAFTNMRTLGNSASDANEFYDIEMLRKEIQKPFYGLTQTVINNFLVNVSSKDEFDKVMKALEAVREYKETKEKKGIKIESLAALTKAAIREGWKPHGGSDEQLIIEKEKKEDEVLKEVKVEVEKSKKVEKLQDDPSCRKFLAKIRKEYGEENWDKWFKSLAIISIEEEQIVLSVEGKFLRDWIIREFVSKQFLNEKREDRSLKVLTREIWPSVKNIIVIADSSEII